jgi:hypothetical protein
MYTWCAWLTGIINRQIIVLFINSYMLYISEELDYIILWNFVKRKNWRLTFTMWLHEEQKNQLKIAKKIGEKGFEGSAGIEFRDNFQKNLESQNSAES